MKKILILALVLCALPAWASITHGGSCSGTTSCTPSSSAPMQLEIAFAFRAGSTTAPSLPSGWTSIATRTGTSSSARIACRVAYTSTPAASGTFTNATNLGIVGYKGTGARALQDCAFVAVAIGGSTPNSDSSTSPSFNTVTMTNSSGTSWVLGMMGDATTSNVCTPSGMSNVSGSTVGDVSFNDTNGGVSNWSTTTCTTGSSADWITFTLEILALQSSSPTLSQLVNGDGGGFLYTYASNNGNNFRRNIDPTGSGNMMKIALAYTYSATRTLTISDDKGDTAAKAVSCNDTGNGLTFAVYYIQNLTAGATVLRFTFDAAVSNFIESHHQFSGMPTSGSPIDGTPSCSFGVTSSGSVLGNIADAAGVTTTTNGDLIYSAFIDEAFVYGSAATVYDMIFGSGYTGLFAEPWSGSAAQAQIQATAGLIKPSMTILQSSNDSFAVMTVAFKTAAGAGTARQSGKIIRQTQGYINSGTGAVTQPWFFPCDTGNFINFSFENNTSTSGANVTAMADTAGNTYASVNPGGTSYPQYWYAQNATCNGQLYGLVTYTGHGSATRFTIYELPNVATSSAIDTSSEAYNTFNQQVTTTLSVGVTSATQTTFSLAAAAGIANGDYLMVSTEVVLVTAGGGTTLITVSRGQLGITALGTIASGTNVLEAFHGSMPSITTSQGNEVIFCSMNQGTGPNWSTSNSTYDFGSFPGQSDVTTTYANGDGNCHAYAPSAGTVNLGWYLSNGGVSDQGFASAVAVKLQTSAMGGVRKRVEVVQR